MEEPFLREIATEYLLPFFSGARLEDQSEASTRREKLVSWRTPLSLAFKVSQADPYRLILTRQQPFAKPGETIVPELNVLQAFAESISPIAKHLENARLKHDLLSTFQRRVVANATRPGHGTILLLGIDQLTRWGSRLYEGAPVSAAIGFRNLEQSHQITLEKIGADSFGYALGNGYDTLLEFDFGARLIGHVSLPQSARPTPFAPFRQASVADWTIEKDTRVAMTLNRFGEILVFRGQQLLFARRSGRWHFLTHEPLIRQMSPPKNRELRIATYETCLDSSFARSGACIGVVTHENQNALDFVETSDRLEGGNSLKARAITKLVRGKLFQSLDRKLRQELAAIDGAIVLSHQGNVLSVGAIVKIPAGSSGGGRRAAAVEMSKQGLGIKVSQDGSIEGFRLGASTPSFRIM